jgi:hypothetical protein
MTINPLSQFDDLVTAVISIGQFVLLSIALLHLAKARADAFPAVGKQTKKFWALLLGIGLLLRLTIAPPIGLFGIVATIAAIIYIVDVKPKVDEISRGPRW